VIAGGVTSGTIDWKEYGLKTDILPRIQPDNFIDLEITSEVSRLDWSNKVQNYPALLTRKATSSVKLKSGQTVTIAGMLETTMDEQLIGVPLLSQIPLLGRLFSTKRKAETKTNVLIFVTPRILD